MKAIGSTAHRTLIAQVVARYQDDDRVRAVAVFGSVATGAWHELPDIDLDVVLNDGPRDTLRLDPADPAEAHAAVIAGTEADYDLGSRRRALLGPIDPGS